MTLPHFQKYSFLNYTLVYLGILFGSVSFFMQFRLGELIFLLLLGFIFLARNYQPGKSIYPVIVIVLLLIVVQGFFWGFNILTFFTFPLFAIITPYLLYRIVGINLFRYLVNIIYFFSITSLIFWFLQNTIPAFDSYLQDLTNIFFEFSYDRWPRSLIFYTVAISKADLSLFDIYRNSGMFHEPGGYAVWLILCIGINTIVTNKPLDKKNIVMSIALLTTFSTAAYVQFFVLILFFITKARMHLAYKFFVFLVFAYTSYTIYTSAEFMKPKVEQHIEEQSNLELEGTYTTGRIVRAMKIFNVVKQSPIFGRGAITASAESNPYSEYHFTGAASLAIFARFGLIVGFLFHLYYYRGITQYISIYNYYPRFALFFFAALFLGGISQNFYFDPVSMQFFFIGLITWHNSRALSKNVRDKIGSQYIKSLS